MSYHQTIYNRLRQHGITEAGALGVLGNFECESNCEPFRLQGDFSAYRTNSKAYVAGVTNGSTSRETFSKDGKGFGIYQLTYWTRKQGYYDYWKQSGKALDDAELQVDYAVKEMQSDYPQLLAFLKTATDVYTACSRVCKEFERPAVNNIDARFAAAKKIQNEIDLDAWEQATSGYVEVLPSEPTPSSVTTSATSAVDHSLNLRTVDWHCEGFKELDLLWDLLELRNYEATWDAVKQFQSDNGLTADGIVGNLTWTKLLQR